MVAITRTATGFGSLEVQPLADQQKDDTPRSKFRKLITNADLSRDVGKLAAAEHDDDLRRVLRGVTRVGGPEEVQVERESVTSYLGALVKRRYEAFHAPVVVMYYIFFVLMLLGHDNLSDMSQVERQYRGMLGGTTYEGLSPVQVSGHKNLGNIDSVADVYTYLQDAVLPLFVPGSTSSPELQRVLRYNQLIGGVVLQQVRRPVRNCTKEYPGLGPFDDSRRNPLLQNFTCFPSKDYSTDCFGPGEAKEGFCVDVPSSSSIARRLMPKKAAKGPKLASGAWQIVDHPVSGDKFSVFFHEHEGVDVAQRRLKELRDLHWIDEQTAWVGIRLFSVNPDLSVYSSAVVNVFFLQSGELIPLQQAFTFMAEPYKYKSLVIIDVLWIIMWLELLVQCIWSMFWGLYSAGRRMEYIFSTWTWINWLTMAMGLSFIIQGVFYLEHLERVKDSTMAVAFNRPASTGADSHVLLAYKDAVRQLHAQVWDFNYTLDRLYRYIGFYLVILMLRLFKAFEVQPRAAIVMETVVQCMPDILHFMVVLFTVNTAFVFSGMFLFGHRILHYSTFTMAFEATFLMLMGSLDYKELSGEHPLTAFLWFFLFVIVMYMIMLNMALAIFMDVYGGMKNKADLSETVLEQASGLFTTLTKWHRRVPSPTLLEAVEQLDAAMVSKRVLMEACPALDDAQAKEIIDHVEAAESFEDEDALTLSDAFRLVVSIRNSIIDVTEQVNALVTERERNSMKPLQLDGAGPRLDAEADRHLRALEGRAGAMEEFMNEVMSYLVLGGQEARDRLEAMEEHLRKKGTAPAAKGAGGSSGAGAAPRMSALPQTLRSRPLTRTAP